MHFKEHAANIFLTIGTICLMVLSVCAIKGVYPFGDRLMFWGDLPQQGIPWLYDAYDVFTGKASSDFTWRYSCGLDGNVSLFSNLFDLPILLINREYIYKFFYILLLFKMCCMGIAMYFFACRYSVERKYRILASVLYGMGSCVLIHYQIGNVMLDMAILFPILMAGFYDLMEKNRPVLYIVLLAFCICKSVYVSFMICMYLFSISIPYFFFCVSRNEFWIKCRNLLISTCIAVGLSSPYILSMLASLEDSNRIAYTHMEHLSFIEKYLHVIADHTMVSYLVTLPIMLSFFMGCALPIAAIRMTWKKMAGRLRYHQAQLFILLAAVFIPGTELLWHGGSHVVWIVRFAFILNFVFLEFFLALIQNDLIDFSGYTKENLKRGLVCQTVLFLTAVIGSEFLLREYYLRSLVDLFFVSVFLLVLWLMFYGFLLRSSMKYRTVLIFFALILEISCNAFHWIAPEFEKMTHLEAQITPDWNTEEYCRYIPIAADLSGEINQTHISPLSRTKDIDHSFNTNYATITNTYSIGNYRGNIPNWIQNLYLSLGYGKEYVRVLDSGGTLFSDALLGIHSTFTTGRSLSEEFYREDPTIHSVRWYWNRYVLPCGMVLDRDVGQEEDVFSFQNHIFHAVTGQEDDLLQEIIVPLNDAQKIPIHVEGRKELYFYIEQEKIDFEESAAEAISVNGTIQKIPNLTEAENTSYPTEFNNRLLDFGTFENETVLLELTWSEKHSSGKVHIGLLDIQKMKDAFREIQRENIVDHVETGISSLSMQQESRKSGMLFLPILFSDCWQCKVNGTSTDIRPVFGGFLGIPVASGKNEIYMEYVPKKYEAGRILAALSAVLGAVFLLLWKKGRLEERWNVPDHGLGVCYLAGSVLFVLFVYLLPLLAFFLIPVRQIVIS